MVTVANGEAKGVVCALEHDIKACPTVIAVIDPAGQKWLLCVIYKGKTNGFEKLGDELAQEIWVGLDHLYIPGDRMHKRTVALDHVKWFSNHLKRQPACLIRDCCSAHRKYDVKARARSQKIVLQSDPVGFIDEWEPPHLCRWRSPYGFPLDSYHLSHDAELLRLNRAYFRKLNCFDDLQRAKRSLSRIWLLRFASLWFQNAWIALLPCDVDVDIQPKSFPAPGNPSLSLRTSREILENRPNRWEREETKNLENEN
jgi:hypothetical protein